MRVPLRGGDWENRVIQAKMERYWTARVTVRQRHVKKFIDIVIYEREWVPRRGNGFHSDESDTSLLVATQRRGLRIPVPYG